MTNRLTVSIDLEAIKANMRRLQQLLPTTTILGVVKANAYGHGAVPVAKSLAVAGVDWLGVASLDEAVELRMAGIELPTLLLGAPLEANIPGLVENDITLAATDEATMAKIAEEAKKQGKIAQTHLLVDTGMGRLGQYEGVAVQLAQKIKKSTYVVQTGTFTHFFSDETDPVQVQLTRFKVFLNELRKLTPLGLTHIASSGSVDVQQREDFSMLRTGRLLYGIGVCSERYEMTPAMCVRSKVAFIKTVPQGSNIGYHPGYKVRKDTLVATIPVGYADGYPQVKNKQAYVLIRNKPAPIIGKVCMDYLTVDVTQIKDVKVGDVVCLLGCMGPMQITTNDLTHATDRSEYEIVLGFGNSSRKSCE